MIKDFYIRKGNSKMPLLFILLMTLLLWTHVGQAQRLMEKLNRGVVAVRSGTGQVFISWRMFGTDPSSIAFNVYRGATKINTTPITNSTNFVDNITTNDIYSVKPVIGGVEQAASETATVWTQSFLEIPIQRPVGGVLQTLPYTYSANDCSVGDLDGDGQYEIIVKWDPSNSKDNAQDSMTSNVYIDAYKLNGTRLWRIDLGKNIRAGAHYTQFVVYDLDGDGRAEMACRTSDGTRDGLGKVIGDSTKDYRTPYGYVLSGPEFLTIFNGLTGAAMASAAYTPARGAVADWGDTYGNRVDRFTACIAYLDGKMPSLVMGRGYYKKLVRSAWDWRNGQLTQRWIFDSSTSGNSAYIGQGNHQLSVGDVDGDGKDEVCNGSSIIDDNGTGLYATGQGHGDALHMTDMDPTRPGQEVWQCLEEPASYGTNGMVFRDARTGATLWGVPTVGDVGRAMAADIDPAHAGLEVWASSSANLYNSQGTQIATAHPSVNFALWWDGDLSREILDGTKLDKWNPATGAVSRLVSFYNFGTATQTNGTKANPNLSADILGDWREEVIYHSSDNTKLLIFTTTIPTTNRIYTLMHDPQYRMAIAWQNTAYNQPPHPGFFLGNGMATPPTPNIILARDNAVIADGTYNIKPVHSGYCLQAGTNSTQQTCNSSLTTQKWVLTKVGNNYEIKNLSTNTYLYYANTNNSTALTFTSGTTNRQFTIQHAGNNQFYIGLPGVTARTIEMQANDLTLGRKMVIWDFWGGSNSKYTFTATSGTRTIADSFEENSVQQSEEVSAAPNPSSSSFKVRANGAFTYVIHDALKVAQENGAGKDEALVGGNLKPGLYILHVKTQKGTKLLKLLKQ